MQSSTLEEARTIPALAEDAEPTQVQCSPHDHSPPRPSPPHPALKCDASTAATCDCSFIMKQHTRLPIITAAAAAPSSVVEQSMASVFR